MDVVRSRSPAGRANPIYLKQLSLRILGGLPEYGSQPCHRADEVIACFSPSLSCLVTVQFRSRRDTASRAVTSSFSCILSDSHRVDAPFGVISGSARLRASSFSAK